MLGRRHKPEGGAGAHARRGEGREVDARREPDGRRPRRDRKQHAPPVAAVGRDPARRQDPLEGQAPRVGEDAPREHAPHHRGIPLLPDPGPEHHAHDGEPEQVVARERGVKVAPVDRVGEGLARQGHVQGHPVGRDHRVLHLVRLNPGPERRLVHLGVADVAHARHGPHVPLRQMGDERHSRAPDDETRDQEGPDPGPPSREDHGARERRSAQGDKEAERDIVGHSPRQLQHPAHQGGPVVLEAVIVVRGVRVVPVVRDRNRGARIVAADVREIRVLLRPSVQVGVRVPPGQA